MSLPLFRNRTDIDVGKVMERAITASSNGIMIVEAGAAGLKTIYVNPAFEQISGYTSAEIVGHPPGRMHHGDADQAALDELRQGIAQQRAIKVVLRNYRKDGSLFWNELSVSPVHDDQGGLTHYVGILNDISDQKRAEQELMTWAMRLDALTTMSAEGLVTFDEKGFLSFVNDAFLRLSGLSAHEVRGLEAEAFDRLMDRQCDPRLPSRGATQDIAELKELGYIEHRETEILMRPPHKKNLLRLAKKGNHGTSLLLYFQDITKARELEELKSEFLATAAHELRTPMASIFGYAELLLLRNFDPEQTRDLLGIILRQARRVTELLDELLDLARIEARRGKDFDFVVQDLRTIVKDVAAVFPDAATRIRIDLPDEPMQANVDKEKLHQALLNILNNALKFSEPDGVVSVSLPLKSDKVPFVGITIADQGIGMTAEQMARLGERFFRADKSGNVPGTGLGVSLAKEIAAIHGGSFEVTSQLGKGSSFTLWLPLVTPDAARPIEPVLNARESQP
jgi:PAS domain S-box-containing protein